MSPKLPLPGRQLPLALRLDQHATLDNFHVSAANAPAVAHLRNQLESADPGQGSGTLVRRFTWLSGAAGAGKSHLFQALCHHASERGMTAVYLPLATWSELRPEIFDGLEQVELICLDDVEQLAGRPDWELGLFGLYNRLAASGGQLFASARQNPGRLALQLPDLRSRMESAAVFQLHALDDEDKLHALQLRARARGFTLNDEVARYLMARSGRGMEELLDVLERLDAYSLETGRRVTVPLLKTLMGW